MIFSSGPLHGTYVVELQPYLDDRGWFSRFYCKKEFEQIGHNKEWVQLNHSVTYKKGTIRGMHYQVRPYAEIKMIRCIKGSVFDVIVDLRKESSTFLKWFGIELSAKNKKMIYIPEGFAHGFQCLTNNCELIYHHTEYYMPNAEAGIRYDDPVIQVKWPLPVFVLSSRDKSHEFLDKNFKGV